METSILLNYVLMMVLQLVSVTLLFILEVILVAKAIKNLLQNSPSLSVAPKPLHSHSVSKSMITNASFRTKKLPGK